MDRKDLGNSPPGRLVKTETGVSAFVPNPLPPVVDYRPELVDLLAQAEADLGTLNGTGKRLANPHLLIHPYIRREAVLSSKIEGTQSTLSDLYLFEVEPEERARRPDVVEVGNYVRAMTEAIDRLDRFPLSLRLVRELHRTLMTGVRGEEHAPGEFRRHQNYIGGPGTAIEEATYVPPPVPEMHETLNAWEGFLHVRRGIPVLIQCAMLHYQFEAIHPFMDGNGRVGRLLITLFLCERGRLKLPLLYLSAFFERHRQDYYERLLAVSRDGDWAGWIKYFLRGVSSQSQTAVSQADRILDLHTAYRRSLEKKRATASTLKALDRLFENPYVTARRVADATGTSAPTAHRIIKRLVEADILREITGHKWGRIFCASELLGALQDAPSEQG